MMMLRIGNIEEIFRYTCDNLEITVTDEDKLARFILSSEVPQ
jgi:hypothetical protein